MPAIRRGTRVSDSELRIATSRPPSCRCAGGRPRSRVPRVYPRVAMPALRLGTRVSDSDRRSARSRALLEVSGPRSYLSPWRLPAMGIVPCCDSRLRGFGTLRESVYCVVGIAGQGWLPVRCPHLRPLGLAVHTGTVPLATILRVFIPVPGHQVWEGGGGASGGGGGGESADKQKILLISRTQLNIFGWSPSSPAWWCSSNADQQGRQFFLKTETSAYTQHTQSTHPLNPPPPPLAAFQAAQQVMMLYAVYFGNPFPRFLFQLTSIPKNDKIPRQIGDPRNI